MPSLTVQLASLHQQGPVLEVRVAVGQDTENAMAKRNEKPKDPVVAVAMIDTGATGTVINHDVAQRLGLQPVGICSINTPSSAGVACHEYLVRLVMPRHNVVVETVAIGAPLHGQHIQCLIGRDVLQHAVFIYTGYNNTFTLSF
jgi:predicted aspartyl protease